MEEVKTVLIRAIESRFQSKILAVEPYYMNRVISMNNTSPKIVINSELEAETKYLFYGNISVGYQINDTGGGITVGSFTLGAVKDDFDQGQKWVGFDSLDQGGPLWLSKKFDNQLMNMIQISPIFGAVTKVKIDMMGFLFTMNKTFKTFNAPTYPPDYFIY